MKENFEVIPKEKLKEIFVENGFKSYRLNQVYDGLKRGINTFNEINNIPKDLKNFLNNMYYVESMEIHKKLISKIDGTRKYLLKLFDDNIIEAVLMKYKYGYSVCISSQVGCYMGCKFCASTINSKVRDLTYIEMEKQIKKISEDIGKRISNIVVMGSGEPFDNYDNTIKFIKKVNDEKGLNIGQRHITISTCGIVDKIYDFADLNLQVNLAISLHSCIQEKREEIMPIAKKFNLIELKKAVDYYIEKTNRKVSYEYALIEGFNDDKEDIDSLISFSKDNLIYVNLIPINPISERNYKKPNLEKIYKIQKILLKNAINATVRREMGSDINGACGQLRINELNKI